jgi:hypothetical protein
MLKLCRIFNKRILLSLLRRVSIIRFSHSKRYASVVDKLFSYYLESKDMKFTFVREINFRNLMDDDPANILILILI